MNILQAVKNFFLDKEIKKQLRFFSRMFIFRGLDKGAMSKVFTIMYHKKYEAGETIFYDGAIGKAIFFIYDAEVEVLKTDDSGKEKVLTRLCSGDFFGEMALLEELPRSATVRVSKAGTLYLIYKVNFDAFTDRDTKDGLKIYKNLVKILSARLRQTSKKSESREKQEKTQ